MTIQEVENALRNENISLPAGTLEADNIDELKFLPIKKTKDKIVRLTNVDS